MKISVQDISFGFAERDLRSFRASRFATAGSVTGSAADSRTDSTKDRAAISTTNSSNLLFDRFSLELDISTLSSDSHNNTLSESGGVPSGEGAQCSEKSNSAVVRPLVILGPSGSGKTTLLKLLGGLVKPQSGKIFFSADEAETEGAAKDMNAESPDEAPRSAYMFQEPRLLPWLTILQNISIPLEKDFGKEGALARAKYFLSLVSLEEKATAYPSELSGGQAQRVSMARSFAWPASALFMDEPFQSLDIPLKINMMDLTLSLLAKEKRLLVVVTHNPSEAVYLGGRIMILGQPGKGIVFDRNIDLSLEERAFGSAAAGELEKEMILKLS